MALPTEPGAYLDKAGDVWMLNTDGKWIDGDGAFPAVQNDAVMTFIQSCAPFTRMPSGLAVVRKFRAQNDVLDYVSDEFTLREEAELYSVDEDDRIQTRMEVDTPWEDV